MNENKPNLLFIFADQWRRQAIGFLNEDPVHTPILDGFASESKVFNNAFACSPICTPNRACLFTGLYPFNSKVTRNDTQLSYANQDTIGRILKRNGYQTGYIGKWHLDGVKCNVPVPREGHQGFDFWYMSLGHQHFVLNYQDGRDLEQKEIITTSSGIGWMPDHETDIAIDYIRKHKKAPFSLFVSFAPPHTGGGPGYLEKRNEKWPFSQLYAAPERFEKMYKNPETLPRRSNVQLYQGIDTSCILPGYFGAVTSIDENIGRMLRCLKDEGLEGNTIVVVTSDHGEMLGSHGRLTKGIWYEESVGVPFLIRWPQYIKPGKEEALLNSIDVMPTLLDLMQLPIPENIDGKSLAPILLESDENNKPEAVYLCFDKGAINEKDRHWRAIRTSKYTYVTAQRNYYHSLVGEYGRVLYDNYNDPYQLNPIFSDQGYDKVIENLHDMMQDWLGRMGDPFLTEHWLDG